MTEDIVKFKQLAYELRRTTGRYVIALQTQQVEGNYEAKLAQARSEVVAAVFAFDRYCMSQKHDDHLPYCDWHDSRLQPFRCTCGFTQPSIFWMNPDGSGQPSDWLSRKRESA